MNRILAAFGVSGVLVLLGAVLVFYELQPERVPTPPRDPEPQKGAESVEESSPLPTDSKPSVVVEPAGPKAPEPITTKPSGYPAFPVDLDPDTILQGRLVDSSEQPLSGVEVYAQIGRDGSAILVKAPGEYERYSSWASPLVATDDDGRFEIAGLDPRGSHYLFIKPPDGFIAGTEQIGRPAQGEITDLGDIVLYRPARIVGTVRDHTETPMAGVMVRVGRPVTPGESFMTSDDPMVKRADHIVFRAHKNGAQDSEESGVSLTLGPGVSLTDTDGNFELRDVDPGIFLISCRVEGYTDALYGDVAVQERETSGPIHLVLEPALRLAVVVRDPDGGMVSGAEVMVSQDREQEPHSLGSWKGVTDENGEVRFTSIRKERIKATAVSEGHMQTSKSATLEYDFDNHLEIILQPGGQMIGRIVDAESGKPVGGNRAMFGFLHVSRTVINNERGVVGRGMHVDEAGYFNERGLEPGPYEISINGAAYRSVQLGPRVLEGGETLDWGTIELVQGIPIDVHVINSAGEPLEGARVSKQYGPGDRARTDSEGNATVYCPSAGAILVYAAHPDYARQYSNLLVEDGTERLQVTIVLAKGGTIVGTVYDEDGAVVAAASVKLYTEGRNSVWTKTTDDDGQFRFEKVTPGSYRMPGSGTVTVADGQTVVRDVHRKPRRNQQRLRIAVLDVRGSPIPDCALEFGLPRPAPDGGWATSYPRGQMTTDADGGFVVFNTRPRNIQVLTPSGRREVFKVAIGKTEELILQLPDDSATFTGTVTGEILEIDSRQVVRGATVVISTIPDEGKTVQVLKRYQGSSGPDGRFQLEALAGTYRMEVTRATNAAEVRSITVDAGQVTNMNAFLHRAGNLQFLIEPAMLAQSQSESQSRLRVTVEASIVGDPGATRIQHGYFNQRVSFTNLRLGSIYTITVTTPDHAKFTESYRVVAGDALPITVKLGL